MTDEATLEATIQDMRAHMNRLRGRLFEAAEATGMPERQEVAFKALIRRLSYDMQSDLEATLRTAGRPQ